MSEELKKELQIKVLQKIKEDKIKAIEEQDFEKAAEFRDKEVMFIEKHYDVNIRGKSYSIRGNEIIINKQNNYEQNTSTGYQ